MVSRGSYGLGNLILSKSGLSVLRQALWREPVGQEWDHTGPAPGIARGGMVGFRPRKRLVLRMAKAPQCVHLALSERQLWPHIQYDKPTRLGGALEPGIFIHLDDSRRCPDRMAFCSGAHGQFKQRRVMLHIEIRGARGPGEAPSTRTTQGLAPAPCGPMLDQPAWAKAHTVKRTDRIWTVEGFPIPMILGFPSDLGLAEDTVLGYKSQMPSR